jgi:hypothetical protein
MKHSEKCINFNLSVTQILHKNEDNDETVVLPKPPANQIIRRTINIEIALNHARVDVMSQYEISEWLSTIYKGTLDINHKTLDMIADELSETISDELNTGGKNPVMSIKLTHGSTGATYKYV